MNTITLSNGPALMTVKEVASFLGFTQRTVWRWVEQGTWPKPIHLGYNARWHRDEVERLAREGSGPR